MTHSYACATQAGLIWPGSNMRETSRVWCDVLARRATTVSLCLGCGIFPGGPPVEWGTQKPIPVPGAQLGTRNTRRELSHQVGTFVRSVTGPPCGVPSSVGWRTDLSMYPAFSH